MILNYRVYQRKGVRAISYIARITGAHPDYILARAFVESYRRNNSRWESIVCCIDADGIYEVVIKRYAQDGGYLSRERKWIVVVCGKAYVYDDADMNAQYVLYCAWLLSPRCA